MAIPCPNCLQPIDASLRKCNNCGVDLGLAAVVAERGVALSPAAQSSTSLALEMLVPRIGDTMIEKGILQPADLQRALDYQQEKATGGKPVRLGQALLELGLIDRSTLDEIITVQVMQLHQALRQANQQLEQRVKERTLDLQRALDRLSELNQLKSNFIANISHELRTPLTHLKGYIDLLADGGLGDVNTQQLDALRILQRAEERLERLIEDLIQFSLASRGELSLNLRTTDLTRLAGEVVERARHKARVAEIEIQVDAPKRLPLVQADEEKIDWVLQQLVDNALKFTRKGGQVTLEMMQEEGRVLVSVKDTGIGIPANRISEIFEPFHQLDGSPTRRYGGTGLGLAMVRQIVDAHGSQIHVESQLELGSRFEFSLPVASRLAPAAA